MLKLIFYMKRFLVLILIITSCQKVDDEMTEANDRKNIAEISKAMNWFQANVIKNQVSNDPQVKSNGIYSEWDPVWEDAITDENSYYKVVEVPLKFLKQRVFLMKECENKYLSSNDTRYLYNNQKLVIQTNKRTGEMYGFFMSFVPSLKYIESNTNENNYLDKKDFDGYLLFTNFSGDLINGWKYKDGKIANKLKPILKKNTANTKSSEYYVCQTTYDIYYIVWRNNKNNDISIQITGIEESTVCFELMDALENNDGGGGSGGEPGYVNEIYTVSVNQNGGGIVDGSGNYLVNSTVTITATPSSGFVFGGWIDNTYPTKEFICHSKAYSFQIKDNRSFIAFFYSDTSACAKLAKVINDDSLSNYISRLRSKMKYSNSVEYGDLRRIDGSLYPKNGQEHSSSFVLENGVKYTESHHTHPSGSNFPSGKDIIALKKLYMKGAMYNVNDFKYGIITDSSGACIIQIENESLFSNYIQKNMVDEDSYNDNYLAYIINGEEGGDGTKGVIFRILNKLEGSGLKIISSTMFNNNDDKRIEQWNELTLDNNQLYYKNCINL